MIQFTHERYGQVVIYEPIDIIESSAMFLTIESFSTLSLKSIGSANIIAFRDKNYVSFLKNRFGTLEDDEIGQFIFNFGKDVVPESKIEDPINSRFEILDL